MRVVATGMAHFSARRRRKPEARGEDAPREDHRPLCVSEEGGCLVRPGQIGLHLKTVFAEKGMFRVDELALGLLDVHGQIHEHGAGAARDGDLEGPLQRRRELLNGSDEEAVLHCRQAAPEGVRLLEGVVPMRWVATCPEIATRGTESMKAVARPVRMLVNPGPEVQMHTPAFRGAGVPVRGVGRRLFVPHEDVAKGAS